MANNERKPGESNKQYLDRIKAQKREQRIQEEIDKVKSQEDYGGELKAPVVTAESAPSVNSNKKTNRSLKGYGIRLKTLFTNPIYRRNFFKRTFGKEDYQINTKGKFINSYDSELTTEPAFVDLTQNAYSSRGEEVNNANSALFNEFVEMDNPAIFTVQQWKDLPENYEMWDSNTPLRNVSLFQGVENGTYKIAPLSNFVDTTYVIPVRTKKMPGILRFEGSPNYEEDLKNWNDTKRELLRNKNQDHNAYVNKKDSLQRIKYKPIFENIKQQVNDYKVDTVKLNMDNWWKSIKGEMFDEFKEKFPKSTISDYYDFELGNEPLHPRLDSLRRLVRNLESIPVLKSMPVSNEQLKYELEKSDSSHRAYMNWLDANPEPNPTSILFDNDSTSYALPEKTSFKFTLGNSKGGFFIQDAQVLNNQNIRNRLNAFIRKSGEPLHIADQDAGAYSAHILDSSPQQDIVSKYMFQGFRYPVVNNENTFVIGTTMP